MKKLIVLDPDRQLIVLNAEVWDSERKLVVDGFDCPYLGAETVKHSRVPGGRIRAYKYSDPSGNEFLVLGEKDKIRLQ